MQILTKKEWAAVIIVLAIVALFLGSSFFGRSRQAVQTDLSVTDTTITINTMENATSTNGLIINDVVVGTGAEAKAGSLVSVQYTGKFADGKVFDSSIPRGQPIQFVLGAGQVIKGWDQGIAGMKVGGKRTLAISPELAYGAGGYPPVIPPNSTLYFDVELTAVQAR
jgi:FKBP-type peptidyl-prolyl cis-trans isomerase